MQLQFLRKTGYEQTPEMALLWALFRNRHRNIMIILVLKFLKIGNIFKSISVYVKILYVFCKNFWQHTQVLTTQKLVCGWGRAGIMATRFSLLHGPRSLYFPPPHHFLGLHFLPLFFLCSLHPVFVTFSFISDQLPENSFVFKCYLFLCN